MVSNRDPTNNNHNDMELEQSSSSHSSLLSLPNEMLDKEMVKHLSVTSFITLGASCRRFHGLFGEDRKLGLKLLQELLNNVVRGEQEEAEQLLKLFPDLPTLKSRVVDYSGRTIEGTAFQIALGAEDVRYHEDKICMAEMIEGYLMKLPDGEKIIAEQIKAQFPEGWEEKEKVRAQNDSAALRKVIDVIANANPHDSCEAALDEFRLYFNEKPKNIITTGKHFNIQLLLEAFKLFDENYDRFGGFNSHKNNLFWRKVIGTIECYLPAHYAQAICQGLYYIVEQGEKLKRNLRFRHNPNVIFFPLNSNPSFRLGHEYAGGGRGDVGGLCEGVVMGVSSGGARYLQTMSSKKHQRCEDFCNGKTFRQRAAVSNVAF